MSMNRYGQIAELHMRTHLPNRHRQLEDPHSYFATMGEEIAAQVHTLEVQLAAQEPSAPDYLSRVGQLRAARTAAEEIVFSDLIWLPPEPSPDPGGQTDPSGAYIGWSDPNQQAIWAPPPEAEEDREITEYPTCTEPTTA